MSVSSKLTEYLYEVGGDLNNLKMKEIDTKFSVRDNKDWRNYVPIGVLELWPELTTSERLLVLFTAQSRIYTEVLQPTVPALICYWCKKKFEPHGNGTYKCPECQALLRLQQPEPITEVTTYELENRPNE
jgi:hypothetical protein